MSVTTLAPEKTKRTLRSFFPILEWLPDYSRSMFRPDAIAALTVWALLVPEAMAYAGIAGVPPEAGLYAAPLALLGYAVFGTSKHLNVGPSSTVAALSFSIVSPLAMTGSPEFISLTIILALLTGILLVLGGLARMGVLADFLSKPVMAGFIVGVAITIVVGQVDKMLGFDIENELAFVPDVLIFIANLGQTHLPTLIIGSVSLALLFLLERYFPQIPAAITVLFLAILVSALLGFEELGIHVVGDIPAGLPELGLPGASLDAVLTLVPGAIAIAVVAFAESVATARTYANKFGYKIDPDQELIALGAANVGSGFSQGFVVDGSLSKTAASVGAGAKTQMVSIIAAIVVLVTILFLTPLFRTLPEATLGAIVIHAVWHLINFKKLARYRQVTNLDFWTAIIAMVGVLTLGILAGLVLAVFTGLIALLVAAKSVTTSIMGKAPGENVYRSLEYYPDSETFPGLLILRFDGSLFFANAPNFADEVRLGVRITEPKPRVVLVDGESLTGMDYTAISMIEELYDELSEAGIELWFARVRAAVQEIFDRAGLVEKIGYDKMLPQVSDGVEAFNAQGQGNV
jgi:high affinity sulfate transporter 1